jgi:hypothetical protein
LRGAPPELVAHWWPLLVLLSPIILIYSKIILHKFSGLIRNLEKMPPIGSFSGPEFLLPAFSLLRWILQNKREKA